MAQLPQSSKLSSRLYYLRVKVQKVLWALLRIAGLVYVIFSLILFFGQDNLVFIPRKGVVGSPQELGLKYLNVKLKTEDGLQLGAWFIPVQGKPALSSQSLQSPDITKESPKPNLDNISTIPQSESPVPLAILFCHGNGGNIGNRLSYLPIFQNLGLSTLLFDYRGYGDSEGKPSEIGTYQDVAAAWRYLTEEQKIPPQRILIYGESLGGAVASYWAETLEAQSIKAGGLILAGTFSHVNDRAVELYPFFPVRLISRFNYQSESRLPKIKIPVLIIHSRDDEIIPFSHGEKLFKAAREPKLFTILRGGHNDAMFDSLEAYRGGLAKFMELVNRN